ncbi:hypothetical protein POX_g09098 [Penicillium oxalicum]|uniref:hypothetical protein n=1 Tax=Penicillium oxalicum TaxID=69781 RepID=UPI0020B6A36E|nr:hypothetical protein POX_g09098 [Penicillium oxalicum]KAI2786710.1 hypothetical protein POX_g09098 [Penicillium oxalicum]
MGCLGLIAPADRIPRFHTSVSIVFTFHISPSTPSTIVPPLSDIAYTPYKAEGVQ